MFLFLALGFAYVLISSIGGPSNFSNPKELFDDVAIGQTAARRVGSDRVWVTRLSALTKTQANTVSSHTVDQEAGCDVNGELCVVLAATARSGIDIIYSEKAPIQLPPNVPWFGGFVDPSTGEVFDLLGRAYTATNKGRSQLRLAFKEQ